MTASFGSLSRSASSSNFTIVFVGIPSACHLQTRAPAGSNSAFFSAVSSRGGVDRAACDLEVDLDVDVGGPRMSPGAAGAQHLGHRAAEHHELRPRAVVVDDPDERPLRGEARAARERSASAMADDLSEVFGGLFTAYTRCAQVRMTRGHGPRRGDPLLAWIVAE